VPHARPTDFYPQSDLIQRAKLLPLPSSPETPMALMMSPVVHLRSPQFTHTLGPWIDEARKIVANTPQRGVEKEMKTTTCVKHQDDIANLQWQPIPFYGTTRPPPPPPPPRPAPPLSPPALSPPSPPLVIVSLEEDTASKEENEEEWLTQRTMKKTPPSLSFQLRKKRGLQQQTNTRPFTTTTRRNTLFGPPSSSPTSPTSRTTSPFKKLPSPPFQRPLPPTLVPAAARRERRRRSLYIGQLMKEQDLAQAYQQHQHELTHNNNNNNNNNTASTQSSNRNTRKTKRTGRSRVVPRVAPRVVPKTGTIALTVLRAMETLKQQRFAEDKELKGTPTSKDIPFVGTTRRGTVFRQEHELPRRLQSSSSRTKNKSKDVASPDKTINHVVKKVGPSLYLKMYLNGKMEVLSSRDSKSPIKLDFCGSGETQWYSEHYGR
jgi:hypothetical protein